MQRLLFLTDRPPEEVLPAALTLDVVVEAEPLDPSGLARILSLGPDVVVVDAAPEPRRAFELLRGLRAEAGQAPVLCVLSPASLNALPWHQAADDFILPGTPEPELKLRLAMLVARGGETGNAVLRLGPVAINAETYRVTADGRPLDLTYKEFELLRFLAQNPGKVFTRAQLLHAVWGYDFYGGTRTVDVHIRRLRAKLGPERENLIETVRGVGYGATVTEN